MYTYVYELRTRRCSVGSRPSSSPYQTSQPPRIPGARHLLFSNTCACGGGDRSGASVDGLAAAASEADGGGEEGGSRRHMEGKPVLAGAAGFSFSLPSETTCRAGRFYNDNIFIHTYVLCTTYYNNTLHRTLVRTTALLLFLLFCSRARAGLLNRGPCRVHDAAAAANACRHLSSNKTRGRLVPEGEGISTISIERIRTTRSSV